MPIYYDHENTGRPATVSARLEDGDLDVGLIGPGNTDDKYTSKYKALELGPQFRFGHGLSFTSFTYGDLELSTPDVALTALRDGRTVRVEIPLNNTGGRPGDEVTMVFIRDRVASLAQPVRRLRRFSRTSWAPARRSGCHLNWAGTTSDSGTPVGTMWWNPAHSRFTSAEASIPPDSESCGSLPDKGTSPGQRHRLVGSFRTAKPTNAPTQRPINRPVNGLSAAAAPTEKPMAAPRSSPIAQGFVPHSLRLASIGRTARAKRKVPTSSWATRMIDVLWRGRSTPARAGEFLGAWRADEEVRLCDRFNRND